MLINNVPENVQQEGHLRHVLLSYMGYYNGTRTHLSLNKDAPISRTAETVGHIICHRILGGLHHQYSRIGFTVGTGGPHRRRPGCRRHRTAPRRLSPPMGFWRSDLAWKPIEESTASRVRAPMANSQSWVRRRVSVSLIPACIPINLSLACFSGRERRRVPPLPTSSPPRSKPAPC